MYLAADWPLCLRKFANAKIQVPHFRGGVGITPNEGGAISAFYSATCVSLSGWVAMGAIYLPRNSLIFESPGRILPPLNHGMHPFCRHFRNHILSSFKIMGVSNGYLSLTASTCLWRSWVYFLLCGPTANAGARNFPQCYLL